MSLSTINSMFIACGITIAINTDSKYVTHSFSTCTKASQFYVTPTLPGLLYLQALWMKSHRNIYTLLASAPAVRFIFVPAVVFICAGKFNHWRNVVHECPKYYLCRFTLKFSKSVHFLFTPVQHTADSSIYIVPN